MPPKLGFAVRIARVIIGSAIALVGCSRCDSRNGDGRTTLGDGDQGTTETATGARGAADAAGPADGSDLEAWLSGIDASFDASPTLRMLLLQPMPPETRYCDGKRCRDYVEAVERVLKLATPGGGPGCLQASIGRCGPLRYVLFNSGFSGFEEYFDMEGLMVAARVHGDTDPDGTTFGGLPLCEKTPTASLCDNGPLDAATATGVFSLPGSPVDTTVAQASSALRFPLPGRATGFRIHGSGLQETMQQMRFELPAHDLAALEKSLPCRLSPESTAPPEDAVVNGNEPHWYSPQKATRHRGCRTHAQRRNTAVLIDLDKRERPTVFVLVTDG